MEKDPSDWEEAVGPMYVESALEGRLHGGISDDLIVLTTSDGASVYPERQFDVLPNGDLRRRELVIRVWNTFIQPAIEEGHFDNWAGTYAMLQTGGKPYCPADVLSSPETSSEKVTEIVYEIKDWVHRLSRP